MYLPTKYTTWYYSIVNIAKLRNISHDTYTERHHIIPKSMGGNNTTENLVRLTAKEHYICHLLLTKMTSGKDKMKMAKAAFMFATSSNNQQRHIINSRRYAILKHNASLARKGVPAHNKGHKLIDPIKLLNVRAGIIKRELKYQTGEISRGNQGKHIRGLEEIAILKAKNKSGIGFSTKEQTPEARERAAKNISKAKKGKPAHNKGITPARLSCLCCKKEVDVRNFSRYHKECNF